MVIATTSAAPISASARSATPCLAVPAAPQPVSNAQNSEQLGDSARGGQVAHPVKSLLTTYNRPFWPKRVTKRMDHVTKPGGAPPVVRDFGFLLHTHG